MWEKVTHSFREREGEIKGVSPHLSAREREEVQSSQPEMRDSLIHQPRERTNKRKRVHKNSETSHTDTITTLPPEVAGSTPKKVRWLLDDLLTKLHLFSTPEYLNQQIATIRQFFNNLHSQNNKPSSINKITILQRPKPTKTKLQTIKQSNSSNHKPLTQRLAEYTQHRARIFNYKLQPGIFNFHFLPP